MVKGAAVIGHVSLPMFPCPQGSGPVWMKDKEGRQQPTPPLQWSPRKESQKIIVERAGKVNL
jgi:hypothetical protein